MNVNSSKIPCSYNAQIVSEFVGLPESYPNKPEPFVEEELIRVYKEGSIEKKYKFLSKVLKGGQSIEDDSFHK